MFEFWKSNNSSFVTQIEKRWSNDVLKEAFQKLHPTLIDFLKVNDVIDELFAAGILTPDYTEVLISKDNNDQNTVRQLLLFLHKSENQRTFQTLHHALLSARNKDKYSRLVSDIEKRCNEIEQQSTLAKPQEQQISLEGIYKRVQNFVQYFACRFYGKHLNEI